MSKKTDKKKLITKSVRFSPEYWEKIETFMEEDSHYKIGFTQFLMRALEDFFDNQEKENIKIVKKKNIA